MRKLIPLALLTAFLVFMVLLRLAGPSGGFLRQPLSYLGAIPFLAGVAVSLLGLRRLIKAGTTTRAFHRPKRLITDGVYRYTRNPIYLGQALMIGGVCILLGAHCLLVPFAAFVAIADRWIIRVEERTLARKFGRDFEEYRGRTPRWI